MNQELGKQRYPHLFSPGTIGTLKTRNRLVMAPMATNYAGETGGVTEDLIEFYELRAKGGAGLLIVENCCVDFPTGKGGATQLRLDDDRFIPGLSRLVEAVHRQGAGIAIQINHSGPAGAPAKTMGLGPVGASSINFSPALPVPRPLEASEIEQIIEKFAQDCSAGPQGRFRCRGTARRALLPDCSLPVASDQQPDRRIRRRCQRSFAASGTDNQALSRACGQRLPDHGQAER